MACTSCSLWGGGEGGEGGRDCKNFYFLGGGKCCVDVGE